MAGARHTAEHSLRIPFGIWFAFWHGMRLHGLWIRFMISPVYSAAVGMAISLHTDWEREVEKVRVRLGEDNKSIPGDVGRAH
ncbi:hypothetical protein BC628DRAFT_1372975 [Trametes gibbosa]|nr:hypothetical protein BC628DRAFT_1372975 [Trametes gibbosa]